MANNVIAMENAKKHYTKAEKDARTDAEKSMTREKVKLKKPAYVKDDKAANKYWTDTVKRMEGISLLDNVDSEVLGRYCCIAARLEQLQRFSKNWIDTHNTYDKDLITRIEAAERNMLSYAEKLGLTPAGRVRLAKKKAEARTLDPEADLYE